MSDMEERRERERDRDRRPRRNDDDGDDDDSSDDRGGRERRGGGGGGGRGRRSQTGYCPEGRCFDYKDFETLRRYVTETGKIKPRRQTGNCSRCQRQLAREVKRARHLALLPFVNTGE